MKVQFKDGITLTCISLVLNSAVYFPSRIGSSKVGGTYTRTIMEK